MGKTPDMVGEKYGRLTVVRRNYSRGSKNSYWECVCDCGKTKIVRRQHLISGNVSSCGCLAKMVAYFIHKIHGLSDTKIYIVWKGMISRCTDVKLESYHNYGGRGIKVCSRWMNSIEAFYEDMGEPPDGMSLERIDTNGDYTPENCTWATPIEQANNKRNTIFIEAFGKKQNIKDWSQETGITRSAIYSRIRLGWNNEDAVSFPIMERIKYKSRRNECE